MTLFPFWETISDMDEHVFTASVYYRDPKAALAADALYWHAWKVQSPRMEHLSRQIIEAAPKILARP